MALLNDGDVAADDGRSHGRRSAGVTVRSALRWALILGAWAVVICGSVFTVVTLAGATPHRAIAALQLVRPWLGIAAAVPVLVAVVYRRPALAVVGGFCVIANVLPVWGAVTNVGSAAISDDAVSIYVANLRYNNATPEAKVDQALSSGADVLVVVELTPEYAEMFRANGVDESYPHQQYVALDGSTGRGIYSRLPFVREQTGLTASLSTAVDVRFGAGELRIVAFHAGAPNTQTGLTFWKEDLAVVKDYFDDDGLGPTVVAGDYNAARWHPAMADILSGRAADAHESVGKGLTTSWPTGGGVTGRVFGRFGPFVRLDHALVYDAGVADVVDLPALGSDHLAFIVTLVPESS